jgi:mannitol/fructose-specific phosphotransferase system IIA component
MAILSKERISLQASAIDKMDAVRKAGELLVKTGCVLPEYVDGMLAREKSASTCLGNGIAIPHGLYENRDHILQSGLSIVQFAQGVEWDIGKKVYLVIGIAASSDEHVSVFANLSRIIDDKNILAELFSTLDPGVILNHLCVNINSEIN